MTRGPAPIPLKIPRRFYREVKLLARRRRAPHAIVQRARLVLMARRGQRSTVIARELGLTDRAVRKWKVRIAAAPEVKTLYDAPRPGRPARIPVSVRCQLVHLACERPSGSDIAFREVWTYASLADALEAKTSYRLSVTEIGRILRFEHLRPHHVRQWLHSGDPEFLPKAEKICDVYAKSPADTVVVCIDEKPMQVLQRRHRAHVDPRDAAVRYEFEYKRHGTQVLLAAFNVKTGSVFGRVLPRRTGEALVAFMKDLAQQYPGQEVFVVWDNLNIHYDGSEQRWTKFNAGQGNRFHFFYTPRHASWMNQVEIWFSILQRRVLRYGNFKTKSQQKERVEGFIDHWNRVERHPFRWTWRMNKLENRSRT